MWLTILKKYPPKLSSEHLRLFDIADAVLNSEKAVHEIMCTTKHMSQEQLILIRHYVYEAIKEDLLHEPEIFYPVEAISFLIMKDWWNTHDK